MLLASPATRSSALAALTLLAACGGGGTDVVPAPPAPQIATLAVAAVPSALVPGETHQLVATAVDTRGATMPAPQTTWTSSAPTVATVSGAGVVSAVGAGTATITASAAGRSAARDVVVVPGGLLPAAGGTVGSGDGSVTLAFPAGAVAAQTRVTIARTDDPVRSEHTAPGTVHELGPDGSRFAAPVTLELRYDPATLPAGTPREALRVARLTGGEWRVVAEGAAVDSARGTVRAAVRSFSSYAVVRDPCVVTPWSGAATDRISPNDCLYVVAGRRSDYYSLQVPAGQTITVTSGGGLTGLFGLKEATADPATGTVWVSATLGGTLRLVSNGSPMQLFVSGQDSTKYGAYTLASTVAPPAHACGASTYLAVGASLAGSLTASNSCTPTVEFPVIPQAAGKPLLTHVYGVKLLAGRRYSVRVGGLQPAFQPTLTVFAGGAMVAQQGFDGQIATARTVVVQPTATGYFTVEISSGNFTDGTYSRWVTPTGSYTLSVTEQ